MKIGANLEKYRLQANFTRDDVARKLNIGMSTLGHWEADRREPSFSMLERLADLYKIKIVNFFGEQVDEVNENEKVIVRDTTLLDGIITTLYNDGFDGKIDNLDATKKKMLLMALEGYIKYNFEK